MLRFAKDDSHKAAIIKVSQQEFLKLRWKSGGESSFNLSLALKVDSIHSFGFHEATGQAVKIFIFAY